jgi:hypothetical protein
MPQISRNKVEYSLGSSEDIPLTVCVAAIYDSGVIGASDRMITAGDVLFEPKQTKLVTLTTSITVMLAGDSSLQLEIMYKVRADVNKRIEDDPHTWWNVQDVAELYAHYYNQVRRKKSENAILAPLGLDHDSFIFRQQEMSPDLVKQLATELINFELPQVSTIVTGVDPTGAHIFVVHGSDVVCQDGVGFAAIGAGYWHANSQLMFGGHHKYKPFPESLLLVYSSKKRAEVAPGVGTVTDMFIVDGLGGFTPVRQDVIIRFENLYQSAQEEQKKIADQLEMRAKDYVEEIIAAATPKEQEALPQNSAGNPPADQKELRDGTQEGQPEDQPEPKPEPQ